MIKKLTFTLAGISLAVCLIAPIAFFLGYASVGQFKVAFFLATIAWFVSATAYSMQHKKAVESVE